jgi:hypothetical protein
MSAADATHIISLSFPESFKVTENADGSELAKMKLIRAAAKIVLEK